MKRTPVSFICLVGLLLAAIVSFLPARAQVTLQQVVSRENVEFNLTTPSWSVGLDGNVYLCDPDQAGGTYVMRLSTAGANKIGSALPTECGGAVAANANGIIAVAHGHFADCVKLYDTNFNLLATTTGFNGCDYDAPGDIEVGASGNFYALDQRSNRIVCISGQSGSYGQILCSYTYPSQSQYNVVATFRVCEATQQFILVDWGSPLICLGLTGSWFNGGTLTQQWSNSSSGVSYWGSLTGGVDYDSSGNLYTFPYGASAITEWNSSGNQTGSFTLTNNPGNADDGTLRISNGQALVRETSPANGGVALNTELFRVFTLSGSTASYARTVVPAEDVLTATYGSETWTAGAVTPFTITLTSPLSPSPTPVWHVWGRPCDSAVALDGSSITSTYQDFGYSSANHTITVPAGCAGLYDIKVTPEQAGWQRGAQSTYWLHDIVEMQTSGAVGTISVYTTDGAEVAGANGTSVAVTNGSTNVTGTGTAFTTTLAAGDIILIDGQSNTIAGITSDTQLTLTTAASATASGLPLYLCSSTPPITACITMPATRSRSPSACAARRGICLPRSLSI